ncbi:extracellular calcium-sensing receptor-like [Protopterus annectens]|uniref:extracellular calcium-sensing receptor-like n=1 Tax=Protopterus annectens TaxID=7888 RepID=UPI001CF99A2B|nr:extracellular calcium-sensing receptor-like [Protopterus annectens]
MIYTTDEINQNPKILSNISLGFHVYDSCYSEVRAVEGSMLILSGKKEIVPNYRCQSKPQLTAIIGDEASASSIPIARILGLYRYPQEQAPQQGILTSSDTCQEHPTEEIPKKKMCERKHFGSLEKSITEDTNFGEVEGSPRSPLDDVSFGEVLEILRGSWMPTNPSSKKSAFLEAFGTYLYISWVTLPSDKLVELISQWAWKDPNTIEPIPQRPDVIYITGWKAEKTVTLYTIMENTGSAQTEENREIEKLMWSVGEEKISHGAVLSSLSNKKEFPSFSRTVPNFSFSILGNAHVAVYFSWTWVGILASDDEIGQMGSKELKRVLNSEGACISFLETFPKNNPNKVLEIVDVLKRSTAKVVFVYVSKRTLVPIMQQLAMHNVTDKVWITEHACTVSGEIVNKEMLETMNGTIGIAAHTRHISGFLDYLYNLYPSVNIADIFIKSFWEKAFGCIWPNNGTELLTESNITDSETMFCSGHERIDELDATLFDIYSSIHSSHAYDAVYAIAYALHNLATCHLQMNPFGNTSCPNILDFQPWQEYMFIKESGGTEFEAKMVKVEFASAGELKELDSTGGICCCGLLHYVRNVHFITNEGDEMFFDADGDPPAVYDIINQQISTDGSKKCVNVGYFDYRQPVGKQVIINDKAIKWNGAFTEVPHSVCSESCTPGYRKSAQKGQPICCFDCVPCSEGEISNQTDLSHCMKCSESQWVSSNRDRCLPRLIEFLSYENPLGIMFAVISTTCSLMTVSILCIFMKYRETPIVKANNRNLSYLLLLSLILCFLCSLMLIGQPMTVTCVLRQALFTVVFSFCIACVLAKTITVVIAFNATKPESKLQKWVGPSVPIYIVVLSSVIQIIMGIIWLTTSPPFVEYNVKSLKDKIIIECNEGFIVMFYCMLGYLGLLAGVCFIVAFLARKLPDSFNEANYITFSMLAFVSVWISFIPAYLSTKGMYLVAVEIFAILSSSIGLICCIFIPKCYIILFRPHMNTREYLMGRGKVQTRN